MVLVVGVQTDPAIGGPIVAGERIPEAAERTVQHASMALAAEGHDSVQGIDSHLAHRLAVAIRQQPGGTERAGPSANDIASQRKESSSTTDDTQRLLRSRSAFTSNVISSPPSRPSNSHSTGKSAGAPLSLIMNTRNLAGLELLAFRSTT
jgi:hypothetical protein